MIAFCALMLDTCAGCGRGATEKEFTSLIPFAMAGAQRGPATQPRYPPRFDALRELRGQRWLRYSWLCSLRQIWGLSGLDRRLQDLETFSSRQMKCSKNCAAGKVDIGDNRAIDVLCYHPGYTFVEKLQTISTKFRKQQEAGEFDENFMRHYYDIHQLLAREDVLAFVGTPEYAAHKTKRFRRGDDPDLTRNQAFVLADPKTRAEYGREYETTSALYYRDKPAFDGILQRIAKHPRRL